MASSVSVAERTEEHLSAPASPESETRRPRGLVAKTSLIGITFGAMAILVGLALEGGRPTQLFQPTAALVVFGGTLSALLVQFPWPVLRAACLCLHRPVAGTTTVSDRMQDLLRYAAQGRRRGMVSLDSELPKIEDAFLRRCLMLVIDGTRTDELRALLDLELARQEEDELQLVRFWDAAGGFAPTIGIMGAVLGLMEVMQRLDNIEEVGRGIAAAFVATLYGVGSANLIFLPLAGRLRTQLQEQQRIREMTMDAAIWMAEGVSLRVLRERLEAQAGERRAASLAAASPQ